MTDMGSHSKPIDLYGKTIFKSFGIDAATKKWWYRIDYSRTKGFYANRLKDTSLTNQNNDPVLFPRLSVRRVSVSGLYVANSQKYSHKSWINQWEGQRRSAGSFLTQWNYFYTFSSADTVIIPRLYVNKYPELNGFRKAKIHNLMLQAGYGHTFVIKHKLALGIRMLLGLGYQSRQFINARERSTSTKNIGGKVDVGLSLIHTGEVISYGFVADFTTLSSKIKWLSYNTTFSEVLLFVGLKFKNIRLATDKSKFSKIKWFKRWMIDGDL